MKAVGVVGPDGSGRTELGERLANELDAVATVGRLSDEPGRGGYGATSAAGSASTAGAASYGLTEGGEWAARGRDRTLDDVLETLAPRYEYAVVEGFEDARLPQIELGGRESAGETLLRAPDADAIDVADLRERIEAVDPFETLGSLVARVTDSPAAERAGAVATFTGRVRAKDDPDDVPTERLEFERYDGVAAERLSEIRADIEAREGVFEVRTHHRTGIVEAGEDIVFVVVLAGHRREAFDAVEDGIDRLKEEVPIFKKEVTVEGDYWVDSHG